MNPEYAYVKNTEFKLLLNILGLLEVSFTTIQIKCWPAHELWLHNFIIDCYLLSYY